MIPAVQQQLERTPRKEPSQREAEMPHRHADVQARAQALIKEHGSVLAALDHLGRQQVQDVLVLAALRASQPLSVTDIRDLALKHGYRPYTVVERFTLSGVSEVELMSWPYEDHGNILIQARTTVGDPTTLEAVEVHCLGDVLRHT